MHETTVNTSTSPAVKPEALSVFITASQAKGTASCAKRSMRAPVVALLRFSTLGSIAE